MLLGTWAERFARSPLSLKARDETRELEPSIAALLEELARMLPSSTDAEDHPAPGERALAPGSPEARELDKTAAFIGAAHAGRGGNAFDLAAALLALRDVVCELAPGERDSLTALFEWLLVVALSGFANGRAAAVEERHAALLEQHTPMIMITPALPALLLMGAPDRLVLDRIFSKLLLAVVRVGAPAAIVDASGLVDPGLELVLDSLASFASHRKIAGKLDLLALGLDPEHERAWSKVCAEARVGFEHHELFAQAVARALERQARGGKHSAP